MPSENRSPSENTRRTFLQSTGAMAAGLYLAGTASAQGEALAVNGGPKAVTASHDDATSWPRYGTEEEQAVLELVRNPNYGPIEALEKEWKQQFKLPYCKAHYNGTSAITAMFFALDLPPGSEIMVPCSTFWATIMPMRFFGLVPVFVDIHPRTLNFDLEDAKRKLTKNTKAMFPVHYLGLPADMDHICDFAKEKGLIALEDACHAHGASLHGKPMGAWGRMACFSFQASKPLPAIEGGMGNYQNREDYERAATLGHYECPPTFAADSKYAKYSGTGLGMKLRMHPMAAALARCQLKKLAKRNAEGTAQTRRLNDRLTQLPGLYEQQNRPDVERVFYLQNRFLLERDRGRHVARGVHQGPEGRRRFGRCGGRPVPVQPSGLSRGPVVAPPARHRRSVSRRGRGRPARDLAAVLHQGRARIGRPVHPGLREGLGAPQGVGQGVIVQAIVVG